MCLPECPVSPHIWADTQVRPYSGRLQILHSVQNDRDCYELINGVLFTPVVSKKLGYKGTAKRLEDKINWHFFRY